MLIRRLVLKLYKRLMLSNLQSIDWTPQSHLMVMLGSNGSGKSSVLEELTPVPSHHSNFAKGGLKEIHLLHKEKEYVLSSLYEAGTGRHSFLVNGEELNQGGTLAVQKQLVLEHFKLDRDIHELMVGIKRFSAMSTKERREWLTKLSPMDLNFAFGEYHRAKTAQRDQVGIIRHLTKRMAGENVDLPDDAEIARQRAEIDSLTRQLNGLFQQLGKAHRAHFQSNESALHQLMNLVYKGKDLLKHYPVLVGDNTTTAEQGYLDQLNALGQAVKTHETMLDHFMHELHEMDSNTPSREHALSEEELTALKQSIQVLEQDIAQLATQAGQYKGCFPLVSFDLQGRPLEKLDGLFERWSALLQSFPDNAEGRLSPVALRDTQERLKQLRNQRTQLNGQVLAQAGRLASIRGCQFIECPKCTHTFQPGVDLNEVRNLEVSLDDLGGEVAFLDSRETELEHYLVELQDYSGLVFQFRSLCNDYAEFKPLWDYCVEHRVMFGSPRKFMNEAIAWHSVMQARVGLGLKQQQLHLQTQKLQQALAFDQDSASFMAGKRKQLEERIENHTHVTVEAKRTLKRYRADGEAIKQFEQELNGLVKQFHGFYEKLMDHLGHLIYQGRQAEIQGLQLQMAETRRYLSELEMREHTLKSLEREHKEAVELQHDWSVLVKSLSPTDGLIGRYLMGFMQAMVGLMNDVIKEVWSHPLEILPSKVDSDELTYLFPLNVNDGAVIAPDIVRGSAGQRDIVDFAFKVLAMKFMGFDNYPLYLDEFGSTFDEAHRHNLVPFLLQLIELNTFQQVFYISHFAATHGAFNQAEFFVVDPTNITVPSHYNENVVIL